jgi:hypothetical protein
MACCRGALEELTNHRPLQFFDQLEFIRARDCYFIYPLKKEEGTPRDSGFWVLPVGIRSHPL